MAEPKVSLLLQLEDKLTEPANGMRSSLSSLGETAKKVGVVMAGAIDGLAHRLPWDRFIAKARAEGALLLDARSERAYTQGHIRGAVNLPFSDFTDAALREVIGKNPNRPIYIYCNNNFTDNAAPVVTKRVDMALNIPTFINLHGYGYGNVWELAGLVSTKGLGSDWVEGSLPGT